MKTTLALIAAATLALGACSTGDEPAPRETTTSAKADPAKADKKTTPAPKETETETPEPEDTGISDTMAAMDQMVQDVEADPNGSMGMVCLLFRGDDDVKGDEMGATDLVDGIMNNAPELNRGEVYDYLDAYCPTREEIEEKAAEQQ